MAIEEDRTGTWHIYGKTSPSEANSRLSRNASGDLNKPVPVAGSSSFTNDLTRHFPEVAATIEDTDSGRLHLEVSALKMATHDAIQKRDWPTVRKHFAFIDNILEAADTELHDAIGISYLVNLFYNETSINFAKARTLMPKRLAAALEIMERHYEDLV
jgi:hypothetical protein